MQEKPLFVLNMENACIYKVFLSTACNKVSSLLFCSLLADYPLLHILLALDLLPNEILSLFYLRGLLDLFPPIYLPYSITLNGLSSPLSSCRSQPYKTLKAYIIYNLRKGMTLWLNGLDI